MRSLSKHGRKMIPILHRQVKMNFTSPESGMLHLKRLLNPGTISSTVMDVAAKALKSDMLHAIPWLNWCFI